MDLSIFSQDSFDPKAWINSTFRTQEAKDVNDIKQYASSMVMRLQLAVQEVNNNLEDTSSQVVNTIPRVIRDIEALSHEAGLLKSQMRKVKEDIEKVENETAASMQTLVELDTLKSRLTSSSQALKEADNWTTLLSDIEEIMDSGDLEMIFKQLVALQNCLSILTHVPDYEERVAHLDGLKVRFEALASPLLVNAFTQHNLENSKKYAKMLHSLGRSENLQNFYHKCELQQLLTIWTSGVEGHVMSGSPAWLTGFYEKLASLITQQLRWCGEVFEGNSQMLLVELTYSTLLNLDPSISRVVSVSIKQQEEPLSFLTAIKSSGDSFLKDYKAALDKKNSNREEDLFELHREVVKAVYRPLKDQLINYQDYEESILLSHLISADLMRPDMSENLQRIRDYCSKLCTQTELAFQTCVELTHGVGFPFCLNALKTYVNNFNERLSQASRHVQQQTISIQDDWTVFNSCLSLIQAAGELLLAVDGMEHITATVFSKIVSELQWQQECKEDPFKFTPDLLLSKEQEQTFRSLKRKVEEDDERLLESSLTLAQEQCQKSVDVALSTIMAPISSLLAQVPSLASWNFRQSSTNNLSASLSPQEYVTQIGQYLMTLPQHLDPLLVARSTALHRALQEANVTAGKGRRLVSESEISAADFLIGSVGQSSCKLYSDVILRIPDVSPNMLTQLTTDIDYMCNILEDLGVTSCEPLDILNMLLKAPADKYWSIAPGNNPRLVAAVRQIRNIPAKS